MGGLRYVNGHAGEAPVRANLSMGDTLAGLHAVIGSLMALWQRQKPGGKGQVVDAAMVDGVPAMMGLIHAMLARGTWHEARGANWLDGAAPFYRCYTCACGGFISVGALEPQFHALLLEHADLPPAHHDDQNDTSKWPARTAEYASAFARKTRDEWAAVFAGSDACVAPVLTFAEARFHPHMAARQTFITPGGIAQAAPAPRFSRTAAAQPAAPTAIGADTQAVLAELGLNPEISSASTQ